MSVGSLVRVALVPLFAALVVSACSEPVATRPTMPTTLDVSGRWAWLDATGQTTRTWVLVQRGTAVEGTSLDDPSAPVPYRDTVSGSLVGYEFTFSATSTQYFPARSQDTHLGGTLTMSGESMSGTVSSIPPVGKVNSFPLTIVRVSRAQ